MLETQTRDCVLEQIIPRKGKLHQDLPVVWALVQCHPFPSHRHGYRLGTFCAEVHSVWTSVPKPSFSAAVPASRQHFCGTVRVVFGWIPPPPPLAFIATGSSGLHSPYKTRFTPAFGSFLPMCRAHPHSSALCCISGTYRGSTGVIHLLHLHVPALLLPPSLLPPSVAQTR